MADKGRAPAVFIAESLQSCGGQVIFPDNYLGEVYKSGIVLYITNSLFFLTDFGFDVSVICAKHKKINNKKKKCPKDDNHLFFLRLQYSVSEIHLLVLQLGKN